MRSALATCVVAILVLGTSASAAADGKLALSPDGVTWSSNLPGPLFDPAFRWVPGDREVASFWVRNRSDGPAVLDVTILGSAVDSLIRSGDISVGVTSAGGAGAETSSPGRHALLSSLPIAPGQSERVDVSVTFDPASTNQSQVKRLDLRFEVRLTEDVSNGGDGPSENDSDDDESDDSGDGRDRNGILPGTGGPAWWLLPAGMLGAGTGWLAVAAAKRREAVDV